jgi:FixJ family two-component response regulator
MHYSGPNNFDKRMSAPLVYQPDFMGCLILDIRMAGMEGAVDFLTNPGYYGKLLAGIIPVFIESDKCEKFDGCFHDAGVRFAKLDKREHEVATMAIQRLSNKEIAQ